ncbi:glycosyltransferase [Cellulophaga baltica]|nr:glycosyltransferase [Cellulophaga baltica]
MNNPLVSIVVPNYNGADYLKECIDSILNQSYTNWELIICDDNSKDKSVEVINSYNDSRILPPIILETNQGAAITRNSAIKAAKGVFIAFLDNDDYWNEDKLKLQLEFMLKNNYSFTYTNYIQFSKTKNTLISCKNKVSKNDLLRNNYILTSTVIYDAEKLGKIYMVNMRKRQDWSLFINIVKKSKYAYCLPLELTNYRKHDNSISANKFDLFMYNFNFYNNALGYNKFMSLLLMVRFLFYYFIKKIIERIS